MVPPGWEHPCRADGQYVGLFKKPVGEAQADWDRGRALWDRGLIEERSYEGGQFVTREVPRDRASATTWEEYWGERPTGADHMPDFAPGSATHLRMYETTSEGTPISPAFATAEELARWLADTGASASGSMTASYEEWLATCLRGWAPSMVLVGGEVRSGVSELAKDGRGPE